MGVWLDFDQKKNEERIEFALEQVKNFPNIERLLVGNEIVWRQYTSIEI